MSGFKEILESLPLPVLRGRVGEGVYGASISCRMSRVTQQTPTLLSPAVSGERADWRLSRLGMRGRRHGFTLIEVLATIMLLAIVIPAITEGLHVATGMASSAKHRTEAAALAESKLNELVATGEWQSGQTAGDFTPDWPDYKWQATLSNWQYDNTTVGLQQLDVQVSWLYRNRQDSITVSTLVYVRADTSSSTGSANEAFGGTGTNQQ
jgi:prepilin-type N-terminal cleavage/methylation domain-containing protein